MLSYIAAVAAAVTIMISPKPVEATETLDAQNSPVRWSAPVQRIQIESDNKFTNVAGASQRPYLLSVAEQAVLKRALFRSIRIRD